MSSSRVWFITGASSGFGRSLTELVVGKGDIVVATLRHPEVLDNLKAEYPSEKLLILKLDVSKSEDINTAFDTVRQTFGRIDVVFNNAGFGIMAEVEATPEDAARKMFDTNFWGSGNVSREAVRFFRDVNQPGTGGRLIVTSSISGLHAVPTAGYYSASKYAVEGLTQALAGELDPEWNIKVTLVEPGTFHTRGRENSPKFPQHPAYTKPTLISSIFRDLVDKNTIPGGNPNKATERIYELSSLMNPPLRLVLGQDTITQGRAQSTSLMADIDKYSSWSEGLGFDME